MNHLHEIAQRLRTMRDIADVAVEDIAARMGLTEDEYKTLESGEVEIPVSLLCEAADMLGITLTELLTGDAAKLHVFSVCRADRGIGSERTPGYSYQALAYGFANRKAEPLLVVVEPIPDDQPLHLNFHTGHEFHYVIEGRVTLTIAEHEVVVEAGDSLYFDSGYPHAMRALDGRPVKILVVVIPK